MTSPDNNVGAGDRMAIKLLVAAGFVTEAKANEALQIAHGFAPGPLSPATPSDGSVEPNMRAKNHDGPCWRNSHADCGC